MNNFDCDEYKVKGEFKYFGVPDVKNTIEWILLALEDTRKTAVTAAKASQSAPPKKRAVTKSKEFHIQVDLPLEYK